MVKLRNRAGARGASGPDAPAVREVDRVIDAARSQRYYVVAPEPDGAWTLRMLDDTTGDVSEIVDRHTAPAEPTAAIMWASRLTGVTGWSSMQSIAGAHIEEAYAVVREIASLPRPGRTITVVIDGADVQMYEERIATGWRGEPIYFTELTEYPDVEALLDSVAGRYRLTGTWTPDATGHIYRHRPSEDRG